LIPDLDPAIDTIILKATARDPVHRFQNCAEFLAAIDAWERTGASVQLPPDQSIEAIVASAVPRTGAHAVASPKTTPSAGAERAPSTSPGGITAPFHGQTPHPDRLSGSASAASPSVASAEAPRRATQSSWSNSQFEPKIPKTSTPIVVATLFGVALLASGAAAGYWYFSHSDAPAAQPPGVPSAPLANASAEPKAPPAVSAAPEPSGAVAVDAPKAEPSSVPVGTSDDTAGATTTAVATKPAGIKAVSKPAPPREPKSEKPKPKNNFNFGY
jgi:hypothetical protein